MIQQIDNFMYSYHPDKPTGNELLNFIEVCGMTPPFNYDMFWKCWTPSGAGHDGYAWEEEDD